MIIAIHQPNFLSWLGYFYKIAKCDVFVFLDDVQYSKNSFINRNKIRSGNDEKWLTCPVVTSSGFGTRINEIQFFNPIKSQLSILGLLKANYSQAPYFNKYFDLVKNTLDLEHYSVAEQNIVLINTIMNELRITTSILRSSELKGITETSTPRLVSICKQLKGDAYLAGFGSIKYQEDQLFEQSGIKLIPSEFKHPVYPQIGDGFIKNLSIIDSLFNLGDQTTKFLQ
jgi:hypothetical protein